MDTNTWVILGGFGVTILAGSLSAPLTEVVKLFGKVKVHSATINVPLGLQMLKVLVEIGLFNSKGVPVTLTDMQISFWNGEELLDRFEMFHYQQVELPPHKLTTIPEVAINFMRYKPFDNHASLKDMAATKIATATTLRLEAKIVGSTRLFSEVIEYDFQTKFENRDPKKAWDNLLREPREDHGVLTLERLEPPKPIT